MDQTYIDLLCDCDREIEAIEHHIDNDKFNSLNPYLVSYAVIKTSGTIETVYKNLVADMISSGASEEVQNYLKRGIRDSSSNPTVGNIIQLLQSLNQTWRQEFEDKTKGTEEKGSLSSLVDLRNSFAHGRSITASIGNVKRYFEDGKTILTWLEEIISDN